MTLAREAHATYRLVYRDLSASLIPATLMVFSALITSRADTNHAVRSLGGALLYFSLYIYTFCLTNQIVGFEEDKLNKPNRPLPSGLWTMTGAVARLAFSFTIFPTVAYFLGGVAIARWAIAWQLIIVAYNFVLHKHWFSKNVVFITLGTIVQLAAAWQIVTPLTPMAWHWILYISVAFGITLHLQDLRDIIGDLEMERKTLPISVGEKSARIILAVMIGILPLMTHIFVMQFYPATIERVIIEGLLGTMNMLVAIRVLLLRNCESDHHTYMLHTYWFCAIIGSIGLVDVNRSFS